ncbi:hypothetical protein BGZ76_008222 [Entomortierella beljakovae]|nr:hypothetical protein BGZ76_008222 [Entomortierella beljakovae]
MIRLILACSFAILSTVHAQPHPTGGSAYVTFHGRLYVQGGDLGGGNLVNQFYSLDLSRSWQTSSPVWSALPSGPINAYHSGGFSADSNSFVTFGRETGSPYTTANFINVFSTSTGSWIGTGSTLIVDPTRRDMTIASDPSAGGQIYFMGGDTGSSGTGRSNVLDIYNVKSSVVSEANVPLPGPQNLQGGAATWLANRKSMLIIGGLSDNSETNVVYLYTPITPSSRSSSASYLTAPGTSSNTNTNTNSNTNTNTNTNTDNINTGTSNVNGNSGVQYGSEPTTGYQTGNTAAGTSGNPIVSGSSSSGSSSPVSSNTPSGWTAQVCVNNWVIVLIQNYDCKQVPKEVQCADEENGIVEYDSVLVAVHNSYNTNSYSKRRKKMTSTGSAMNLEEGGTQKEDERLNVYEDGSKVAVFGGFVNRSSISDHSLYLLDTRTWSWTISTSNSVRGRGYSACTLTGNQFVVWGGFYQNPTSTPNNLPSVEESTLVYSFDSQNWVNTFVPSGSSYGSGSNGQSGSGDRSGDLNNPKSSKSIGMILAIAAVGALLAVLITGGAVMVIRKRNKNRKDGNGNNNNRSSRSASVVNLSNSSSSIMTSSNKKSGTWDQKTLTGVTIAPKSGSGISSSVKEDIGVAADEIPPVSGYNSWEHRGSITSGGDNVETTTLTTNPMAGITQTTIVTTPKNSGRKNQTPYYPISVEREYR